MRGGAWELRTGEALDLLREIDDASFDSIVCDPPYGLSVQPDAAVVLKHWLAGDDYEHRGGGFMGKTWDGFVPGPSIWREAFRVLKPGGFLLAFAGTRTQDLMGLSIRLAGFEVRDSLLWLYGEGMPKSKAIPDQPGFGTGLKPAHEPILVARKPFPGTVVENVAAHGTGALNIDGCRIEHESETDLAESIAKNPGRDDLVTSGTYGSDRPQQSVNEKGRHPANVVLTHAEGCELVGTATVDSDGHFPKARGPSGYGANDDSNAGGLHGQTDLEERHFKGEVVEEWDCVPGCPVAALDQQSGISRSSGGRIGNKDGGHIYGGGKGLAGAYEAGDPGFGDVGGASRFFYQSKTSRAEREAGLGDSFETKPLHWSSGDQSPGTFQGEGTEKAAKNFHPTVKPIKLDRWLIRLVTPPNGRVLVPYSGSGSEVCAAILEGFEVVGIEREPEYVAIAAARCAFWEANAGRDFDEVLGQVSRSRRDRKAAADAGQMDLM